MANEIKSSISLTCNNVSLKFKHEPGAVSITQNAAGGPTPGYVTIGTSEESIAFGELSTQGWLIMQNLDATNYIDWGFATTVYGGRLKPGECASFRLKPSTTLYIKANSSACKALVYALED